MEAVGLTIIFAKLLIIKVGEVVFFGFISSYWLEILAIKYFQTIGMVVV